MLDVIVNAGGCPFQGLRDIYKILAAGTPRTIHIPIYKFRAREQYVQLTGVGINAFIPEVFHIEKLYTNIKEINKVVPNMCLEVYLPDLGHVTTYLKDLTPDIHFTMIYEKDNLPEWVRRNMMYHVEMIESAFSEREFDRNRDMYACKQ